MEKHIHTYQLQRYQGPVTIATREITFEIKLFTRLMLDELCFQGNKIRLEKAIDRSIDLRDRDAFMKLSKAYNEYVTHSI